MVILLRKRDLMLSGVLCCFVLCFAAILWNWRAVPVFAAGEGKPVIVVVDPGHGGEDGGAVSSDGVKESFLWKEREAAYQGVITPDCRVKCSGCGANKLCEGGVCHG